MILDDLWRDVAAGAAAIIAIMAGLLYAHTDKRIDGKAPKGVVEDHARRIGELEEETGKIYSRIQDSVSDIREDLRSHRETLSQEIAAVIEELGPMSVPSIAHALAMDTPRDRAKIRTTMHRYKDAFTQSSSGIWEMSV